MTPRGFCWPGPNGTAEADGKPPGHKQPHDGLPGRWLAEPGTPRRRRQPISRGLVVESIMGTWEGQYIRGYHDARAGGASAPDALRQARERTIRWADHCALELAIELAREHAQET